MKIYGNIEKTEKQEDGTIFVYGFASSEAKDSDGEVIKADAIKGAIPDYMKFANVREMHKADKAAGTVLEMEVQADGRTFIKTHIVDAEAVKKVNAKVYKGFSIGGKVTERDADDKTIIKGIRLSEISLVDRPANPESIFTFCKVDDADADKPTDKPADEPAAPAAAVEAPKAETPAVDAAAEAEKVAKAAKAAEDLKKGMWAVGYFARILSDIVDLQNCAEWEAASEGDGSTMPAELVAWLKQGGELLKAMVTEEVAELTPNEVVVDVIQLADRVKLLVKAAFSTEDSDKFTKGFDVLLADRGKLAKAGARNSAADQKHLNAIHDAACAMGAACDTDKSVGAGDLLKSEHVGAVLKKLGAADMGEAVTKAAELVEVAEGLAKRVKALEELPAAPKATLKVVEKNGDTPAPEKPADEPVVKVGTPGAALNVMKKVHQSGGKVD